MNDLLLRMDAATQNNDIFQAVIFSTQAVELLNKMPQMMNSMDYITTARALFAAEYWEEARKYWEKGIEKSNTSSEHIRVSARRGYAEELFRINDPEQGREWYQRALKIVSNDRDFHKHLNAYTYLMWYRSESEHVLNGKSSEEQYLQSRRLYESVSNRITKERGLQRLEELKTYYDYRGSES